MNTESEFKQRGYYATLTLLTLLFLLAGISKLTGSEMQIETYSGYGLPLALMYFIGFAEVLGAIGLWIRRFSILASAGLAIVTLLVLAMHAVFDPVAMLVPALVLPVLLVLMIKLRCHEQKGKNLYSADCAYQ